MEIFTVPQFFSAWNDYLLQAAWQTSLAALIVIAIVKTCKFLPAKLRYGLLAVAALKFAVPYLPEIPFGVSLLTRDLGAPLPLLNRDMSDLWPVIIAAIHLAGLCFAAVRLWQQQRQLRSIRRNGIEITTGGLADELIALSRAMKFKRPPQLLTTASASIPFAFGLRRQTLVMPEAAVRELTLDELKPVLAHELAHLRSWDQWANWCQAILGIVWWFNPVYHWLSKCLREVREECRDDEVLASGLSSSRNYSASLLAVAALMRHRQPSPIALHMVGHHLRPLASRLARIADPSVSRRPRLTTTQLLLLSLIALLLLPGAAPGGKSVGNDRSQILTDRRPLDLSPTTEPDAHQRHREAHRHSHH